VKILVISLPGAAAIGATFAYAQQNLPQVQHVVVVIQENRTPDNLFGSDVQGGTPQLPGADLVASGKCSKETHPPALMPLPLDTCHDPNHGHSLNKLPYLNANAWVVTYDGGQMDGACTTSFVPPLCTLPLPPQYAQLSYVENSSSLIQPYFDIATRWGFANYMFQTNQGPSFEAHQFLFSGTSAPDYYGDPHENCYSTYGTHCWGWFAAENYASVNGVLGCPGTSDTIYEIDPGAAEQYYPLPGPTPGVPCYNHNTMATLLDANNVTWAYYPQGPNPNVSLWTAPNAISGICLPLDPAGLASCWGAEWMSNVNPHIPPAVPQKGQMAPILTDIQNCQLPQVSWVIPDGVWSDHPGCPSTGCLYDNHTQSGHIMGPSWVADIVNAVGASTACDGGKGYWNDTVILITWDDWGGWYDHISPSQTGAPGIGYPNRTGTQYVYGFRVPLLVVSAYAKQRYISGKCGVSPYPSCPNLQAPYVHDFGSILNFIEYAFGTGGNPLHFTGQPVDSGISPQYLYADALAPDGPTTCSTCTYGLADFFRFDLPANGFGAALTRPYGPTWFENFGTDPTYPASSDPDNDAVSPTAVPIP
jgi:phospholipase C